MDTAQLNAGGLDGGSMAGKGRNLAGVDVLAILDA